MLRPSYRRSPKQQTGVSRRLRHPFATRRSPPRMPSPRPARPSRLSGQPHQTMASTRHPSRHPSPQETVPITFRTAFYGKEQLELLENKLCDFRSPPSLPHRKRRRTDSHDQDVKPTKPFKHIVCSTPHAALLPSCSVPNASMRSAASIERSGRLKLGVRPSPTQQRRPHHIVASTQRHSRRPEETVPTAFTTAFCGREELESMVKRDQVCEWLRGLPCPASQ